MEIYDPTGGSPVAGAEASAHVSDVDPNAVLSRKRLGVIENGNANADFVLERLADGLVGALGWDPEISWVRKPSASVGASSDDIERLARTCGLVLAGTAD